MENRHEREIKRLKDVIKFYESLKVESESAYAKDYEVVPFELKPDMLERKIKYYKAVLTVYEYYAEKIGEKECLMLGKYVGASMYFYGSELGFNLYLEDGETRSKLYNYVFGSYSGINEFVQDHFPDIFSVILGTTGYSHAFGCYDLNSALGFFKSFGYRDDKRDSLCWDQKEIDMEIDDAKKIIDWFVKLGEDTELMSDVDKVFGTYLEVIFKHNKDE